MREKEYMKSYLGLALAVIGFLVIFSENWGTNCANKVIIILMYFVIAYFVLCSILVGLRKKYKTGRIKWLSGVGTRTKFGNFSLFVGLITLGNSFLQHGYPWGIVMLLILAAWGVFVYGFITRPAATIRRSNKGQTS